MNQKKIRTLILIFGVLSAGGFIGGGFLMHGGRSEIGSLAVLGGLGGVALALLAEIGTTAVFRRKRRHREDEWIRHYRSSSTSQAASTKRGQTPPPKKDA